ncbi:GtrA family protein [Solicola sp. PLA-1-18]|uniref:GtrA family protein n=1 Tax=Solicola sp. PLA-1-18 TaxID=3380532 RepID=UPI003B7E43AB
MTTGRTLLGRVLDREALTFLVVGGAGYVVDVGLFNALRAWPVLAAVDPTVSKLLAVVAATAVTYLGNRTLTWRGRSSHGRRREVALFVMLNVVGLGFSVLTLWVSHDLLGWTSGLADNVSANVVGLALGTAFRYWSYRRFVFAGPVAEPARPRPPSRPAGPTRSAPTLRLQRDTGR